MPEFIDDQDICKFGVALVFFNETKLIGYDVPAYRICTLPSSLTDYKDQLETILHDGMIDRPGSDTI